MGNGAKNKQKVTKRNKISQLRKLQWKIRKERMDCGTTSFGDVIDSEDNVNKGLTNGIFSDVLEGLNNDVAIAGPSNSTLISPPDDVFSQSEIQYEINKNPNWCWKTYPVVKHQELPSFQVGGRISSPECQKIMDTSLHYETVPKEPNVITGNRIVELGYVLDWAIGLQYEHSKICTSGKLYVHKEMRTNKGLSSSIIFKCTQCNVIIQHETENHKLKSEVNSGAVWGTMATGSTFGHLEELLSCMNIPCMSAKMFYDLEKEIGIEVRKSLWRSMEAAGVKEHNNALQKGQVCADGVPWITVYVDGSWSKRSYGTNYNSLSGMVGIIGRFTKELLFVAVKNKFCSICTKAENKNCEPNEHICHKNWNHSASSMEAHMVVEGFSQSEEVHNLRYLQVIADGDSSMLHNVRQKVPYGNDVKKIECTNHALKNYGKHLRKVKSDTTIQLAGRKVLTLKKIEALTKRAKCSIYEHSKKENPDATLLRDDLRQGLHHVFEDHVGCQEGTCNDIGNQTNNQIPILKSTFIYNHLQGALNLLLRKAHLLISNENNNAAERLMNIVSRFNMGKRLNLIQRGSYERRVYLSGLRYNKAFHWHQSPWKNYTGSNPGHYFSKYMETQTHKKEGKARKRLFSDNEKENLPKKKVKTTKNIDYGNFADMSENQEDLDAILNESDLLIQRLQVSKDEIDRIQKQSVGQFGNKVFEAERKLRLTASLFGKIINRRPHTPCNSFVKACLLPSFFSTDATEYGIAKESVAILKLEQTLNITVQHSGFWIDEQYGFLGASPH